MTKPNCPDVSRLLQLLDGALPAAELATVQAHIEQCSGCQKMLEQLAAGGETWDEAARILNQPAEQEARLDKLLDQLKSSPDAAAAGQPQPLNFLTAADGPDHIGKLGRYQIIEKIGSGGMGIVLRAFDPVLHRVVAVKVLAPQLAASGMYRRRFAREALAAAAICHDHVITIHAVEEIDGLPVIVMQLVEGCSLQQKLDDDGPLDVREILRIGLQTAEGLAAAHKQGLVHRDIKPANILLENGVQRVKITDFGLARAVDDSTLTQPGTIAGTPQYMAPEQARGEAVDARADLFSLGCVLYAMCTGRAPFRATTTLGVLKKVCEDAPRPIAETNPEIPGWLIAVITRLMAKDPNDRIGSAREAADLLAECLAQLQHPLPSSPRIARATMPPPAKPALPDQVPPRARWYNQPVFLVFGGVGLLLFCPLFICGGFLALAYTRAEVSMEQAQVSQAHVEAAVAAERQARHEAEQQMEKVVAENQPAGAARTDVNGSQLNILCSDPTIQIVVVTPERGRHVASGDVLISNIPAGQYRWTATRDGKVLGEGTGEFSARGGLKTLSLEEFANLPPVTIQQAWMYSLESPGTQVKARISLDVVNPATGAGEAYVGFTNGTLVCLDLLSGKPRWKFASLVKEKEAPRGFVAEPTIAGDLVLLGDDAGTFYAIRRRGEKPGELAWKFDSQGEISGQAAVFAGRVVFGSADAHVYCLDLLTGNLIWKREVGDRVFAGPVLYLPRKDSAHATPAALGTSELDGHERIDADKQQQIEQARVYVSGCDGSLRMLSLKDGIELERFDFDSPITTSPLVLGENHLCVATRGGELAEVRKPGAKKSWMLETKPALPIQAGPIQVGEYIVVGSDTRNIYAEHPVTRHSWVFPVRDKVIGLAYVAQGSFPGQGEREASFAGCVNGSLNLLTDRGRELWQLTLPSRLSAGPAFAAPWLLIGTDADGGVVHAFRVN